MIMLNQTAFDQGYEAASEAVSLEDNPYEQDTEEYFSWEDGWWAYFYDEEEDGWWVYFYDEEDDE